MRLAILDFMCSGFFLFSKVAMWDTDPFLMLVPLLKCSAHQHPPFPAVLQLGNGPCNAGGVRPKSKNCCFFPMMRVDKQ